jgi:hypothetical protein
MTSILTRFLVRGAAALLVLAGPALADDTARPAPATPAGTPHDFDAQHGRWHTTVRRLVRPLSGSQEWAEYAGTSVVHPLVGGRANIVELDVSGPRGRIEGVSLRLFEPDARRWTLRWANAAGGTLDDRPLAGGFAGSAHGLFYGEDTLAGRPVLVRFEISVVDPQTVRFEQSFSADGGKTWETNWIAVDRRM